MDFKHLPIDEQIIKKYQEDEQIMIQLFAQWCKGYDLDANKLYARAYPAQQVNLALQKVLEEMDGDAQINIEDETMLDVLQLFGNDDLAFVITEEIERIAKSRR